MTPNANDLGTSEWLVSELVRARLLERGQLDPILAEFQDQNPYADANALAQYLVDRQLLTPFQATRSLEGEARKLVLGPYLLVDAIGNGSMGTVYLGLGRADRQKYAVKVLPLRSLWNVRLARRQVRAFAELPPHTAVVPFLDVGTAIGVHYLVWPFVDGLCLEKTVQQRGPLPFIDIARIGIQISEALQNCHPRGLFHGLLKPSNVMICPDNQVRLLDFGIGALLAENMDEEESLIDTISTANATAGILDCASPESIVDPTRRTPAGDQYSLGCTLYYATTGRYPFPDGNAVEKMMAHQSLTPASIAVLRPETPNSLVSVINRLMSKRPEARFSSLDELIDNLMPITRGSFISNKPKGVPSSAITTANPPKSAIDQGSGSSMSANWTALKSSALASTPNPNNNLLANLNASKAADRTVSDDATRTPPPSIQNTPSSMPMVNQTQPTQPEPTDDDDFDSAILPPSLGKNRTPMRDITPRTPRNPNSPPIVTPTMMSINDVPEIPMHSLRMPIEVPKAPEIPAPQPIPEPVAEVVRQEPKPITPSSPPQVSGPRKLSVSLPPPPQPSVVDKVSRVLMFWLPKTDIVQCSCFAIGHVSPGETVAIQVFTHHPDATESVLALAQAFHPQTASIGAAYLRREVARNSKMQVYLDMQGTPIDLPLQDMMWRGQPVLLSFSVTIPKEAGAGSFNGVLSFGQDNVLVGQVPVEFQVS